MTVDALVIIEVVVEKFSSACEEVDEFCGVGVAMQASLLTAAGALSALAGTYLPGFDGVFANGVQVRSEASNCNVWNVRCTQRA